MANLVEDLIRKSPDYYYRQKMGLYAAPERGDGVIIPQNDVYSFGLVLAEMLGREPGNHRPLREINRRVPESLANIIERNLYEYTARHKDAQAMLNALEGVGRTHKSGNNYKPAILGVSALAALFGLFLGWTVFFNQPASTPTPVAKAPSGIEATLTKTPPAILLPMPTAVYTPAPTYTPTQTSTATPTARPIPDPWIRINVPKYIPLEEPPVYRLGENLPFEIEVFGPPGAFNEGIPYIEYTILVALDPVECHFIKSLPPLIYKCDYSGPQISPKSDSDGKIRGNIPLNDKNLPRKDGRLILGKYFLNASLPGMYFKETGNRLATVVIQE